MEWHIINTVEKEILRGRVKVPTGGRVRDPVLFLTLADPVRFRNRQYSLDERRKCRKRQHPLSDSVHDSPELFVPGIFDFMGEFVPCGRPSDRKSFFSEM